MHESTSMWQQQSRDFPKQKKINKENHKGGIFGSVIFMKVQLLTLTGYVFSFSTRITTISLLEKLVREESFDLSRGN